MAISHQDKDIFEDIVLAEENCQQEGYVEGVQRGERAGYEEGYDTGVKQGKQIGAELGFYLGFAETWKALLMKTGDLKPRQDKALSSLITILQAFPLDDPENSTLQDQLHKIRAKFKQVTSLLHIDTGASAGGKEELSF